MKKIKEFLANESYWQSSVLTSGAFANSLLGLVFYVIVARALTVSGFGYFSFLLGIATLGADLGDLGLGTAIVRFIKELDFKVVNTLVLAQRGIMTIIFIALAGVAALFYPANFLLAAVLAGTLLLLYQLTQSLLAWQKYFGYVLTNVFGNTIRLAAVFLLIRASNLTPETAILSFIVANIASMFIAFVFIVQKVGFPFGTSGLRNSLLTVVQFSNWLGLSFALAAVSSRIGSPIIYLLGGAEQAGIFSAASRLASFFPQVISSVEGVFAPKIASKNDVEKHQRDYQILAILLAVGLVLLIPFAHLIITTIFGSKYFQADSVLQILLAGSAVFFLAAPFSATILYKFGKSSYHFVGSVVTLVLSLILYYFLVPPFGANGAALVALLSNVALFATLFLLKKKLDHD